jgi:hypothetical protein
MKHERMAEERRELPLRRGNSVSEPIPPEIYIVKQNCVMAIINKK